MKRIKYILYSIIMILMIALLGYSITGNYNHELLGISFTALICMHLLINYKWFANIKKIIKNSGNSLLNILWLLVNIFLIIDFVILFVSSIVISEKIFSFLGIGYSREWIFVHTAAAYAGFILICINLGMHWQMIINSTRKGMKLKKDSTVRKILLRIIVAVVVFLGISASFRREIGDKFTYYTEASEKQVESQDYIGNLYLDYFLIASIYIAGGHYSVKLINKFSNLKKKRK